MIGCKLNRKTIQTLIKFGTSTDIMLLLKLSTINNSDGLVEDINYLELSKSINCSIQSYYNSLKHLQNINLIKINKASTRNNCIIINNKFLQKNYKNGYMNTNLDFLYSEDFKNIKLNTKKIVLMYFLSKNKNGVYEVKLNTLANNLNLTKKHLIWNYIDELKKWFTVIEEKSKVTNEIKFRISLDNFEAKEPTKDIFWNYKLNSMKRKYKANIKDTDKKEIIKLIKIYGYKENFKNQFDYLLKVIDETLSSMKELKVSIVNNKIRQYFHRCNMPIPSKNNSSNSNDYDDDFIRICREQGIII